MSEEQTAEMVLRMLEERAQQALDSALTQKMAAVTEHVDRLWDKYRVTLPELRVERAMLESRLDRIWLGLGYA